MSLEVELIRAILVEDKPDRAMALGVLETALEREVDVLLYCAATLGLGADLVMQRAARWAGFTFNAQVPLEQPGRVVTNRLETLADVRLIRVEVDSKDRAYAAPDFHQIIRLRRWRLQNPRHASVLCLVPSTALADYVAKLATPDLLTSARQNLALKWPYACAQLELTFAARLGFVLALAALLAILLAAPFFAPLWLLPVAFVLLIAPASIRIGALAAPIKAVGPITRPEDEELPLYSVLVPLRNETAMVPQLFASLGAIDYPAERLDIKFVVESASESTVAAVQQRLGDPRFSLVVVPDAKPRTKPKAINFALPLCRGEHVVVFDAEDVPDRVQLWKAALRFRDDHDLVCLQAHLVMDNGRQGWLSALFAGEYAGLFTVLLPALAQWCVPMPLGGTSNHFRTAALRELGGWDAFNVTEDADLGLRLSRRRLRVDVLDSATHETAPTRIKPWMGQRTRWMKGWMQTFVVHNRNPILLLRELGWPAFLVFEALVLGMIIAPVLHCGFALVLAIGLLGGWNTPELSAWWAFYLAILILGYGSALAMVAMGLARTGQTGLLGRQALLPVYWLLMGIATLRAACELVVRPFYWFKSPHEPIQVRRSRIWGAEKLGPSSQTSMPM